ncbi:hypothetical protein RB597_003748 [Gaeumannomyces tritici]
MLAFRVTSRAAGRTAGLAPNLAIQDLCRQAWRKTNTAGSLRSIRTHAQAPSTNLVGLWQRLQASAMPLARGLRGTLQRRVASKMAAPSRGFHGSRPRRTGRSSPIPEVPEESLSLSQRMKKLSREYGWATVGIYFALSVLDFPFCFLLVRVVGTDRIAEIEHVVVSNVSQLIPTRVQELWNEWRASRAAGKESSSEGSRAVAIEGDNWGVKEAQQNYKMEASLATQLALAYAVHKSFIFIRVPLTAAITPRVVKVLRSWGWEIGKRRPKA